MYSGLHQFAALLLDHHEKQLARLPDNTHSDDIKPALR